MHPGHHPSRRVPTIERDRRLYKWLYLVRAKLCLSIIRVVTISRTLEFTDDASSPFLLSISPKLCSEFSYPSSYHLAYYSSFMFLAICFIATSSLEGLSIRPVKRRSDANLRIARQLVAVALPKNSRGRTKGCKT
ncbi:hypothetical protein EV702DRAFT_1101347 [Suillus placidus]|uniref:Uncharacterized protein n=1 Tax=Suillus placidus TaxID=48579 RepID=A0A9P6ZVA6_9AGAM|nr:hypothetical protein EV702DRAFT_1101347 [Suillus placidus]